MKKIVYTVLSAGYDQLAEVPVIYNTDFYVLSCDYIDVPLGWKFIHVENKNKLTSVEFNRFYKMMPYEIFPEAESYLYVDANINIVGDLDLFFGDINDQVDIAMYKHPVRRSLVEEAETIKRLGYDYFFKVNKQVKKYLSKIDAEDVFFEANIIFRKNNLAVNRAMQDWFNEFKCGVKRDQISINYICNIHPLKVCSLGEHDARFNKKYFVYQQHLKKSKSFNYKAKIVNAVARILFPVLYKL